MNSHKIDLSFEQYLRAQLNNSIDFRLRVLTNKDGDLVFYIHPQDVDGDTLDFKVDGNTVECVTQRVMS
jgi:hypothetical protein